MLSCDFYVHTHVPILPTHTFTCTHICTCICSIVNNKLWSMQLEIPSHTVVVRQRPTGKPRGRVFSLNRRESYASRLVEESMEKISEEEDRMEMAAARVRMNAEGGVSPSGTCGTDGEEGLPTLQENEEEEETEAVTATQDNVREGWCGNCRWEAEGRGVWNTGQCEGCVGGRGTLANMEIAQQVGRGVARVMGYSTV